jgi:recombination protein RecA
VVEKSGSWFSYDGQRVGQGRENAKLFLKQNPEIAQKIEAAIRQNAGLIADRILGDVEDDPEDFDPHAEDGHEKPLKPKKAG